MKLLLSFVALLLSTPTLAFELVKITGGSSQTIQVQATQYRTVMVRQLVDTTCTAYCYPTEDDPHRCIGVPDETYACREWQTLPEQRVAHQIEAAVTIDVKAPANGKPFNENLRLSLNNARVSTEIENWRTEWTVAETFTMTKGEVRDGVQKITLKIELTPHDRQAFYDSIKVSNASYANGVLTYETGALSTMPITHQIEVFHAGGLFQSSSRRGFPIATTHLNTVPFAGGLKHSVNLRAAGVRYKKGKNEVLLRVAATLDPQLPNTGFATSDGYSMHGKHEFTIRIK